MLPRILWAPRGCCYYRLRDAGKLRGEPARSSPSPAGSAPHRLEQRAHARRHTHTRTLTHTYVHTRAHTLLKSLCNKYHSFSRWSDTFLFTVKCITLSFWRFKFIGIQTKIKSIFLYLSNTVVFKKNHDWTSTSQFLILVKFNSYKVLLFRKSTVMIQMFG